MMCPQEVYVCSLAGTCETQATATSPAVVDAATSPALSPAVPEGQAT